MGKIGGKRVKIDWTEEMDNFLRNYPDLEIKELAEELEISETAVLRRRKLLGVKSTLKILREQVKEGEALCTACMEILPLDAFFRNKSNNNKSSSYCKECSNIKTKAAIVKRDREKKEAALKIEKYKNASYKCCACKEVKSGEDFYYNSVNGTRDRRCKICKTELSKQNEIKRIKEGKGWA